MDKRVQNRLKRDELDKMMKSNPTLNEFLNNVTDEDKKNPELVEIIEPVVHDMLEKARMEGVHIGWGAGLISAYKKAKDSDNVDNLIKILHDEANEALEHTGVKEDVDIVIKWQEFDEDD